MEAVVCLANGSGGVLLVGVEDDGTPTGARARHEGGRTDSLRLQALIANNTQPPVATTVGVVDLDGASVIVVEVPDSPRVVGTTRGTYLRRAVSGDGRPMCVPYHAHEMLAHEVDRGAVDYASLPIRGARWEDLDPLEFERVRRLVTEAGSRADSLLAGLSDREIAHALGLVRDNAEVTTGALLLFGHAGALRRFVPTHEAAFRFSVGWRSRSMISSPTRSFGWPQRCSAASEREIGRRSCNLAFSVSRFPRTPRPHSGKRSPTH